MMVVAGEREREIEREREREREREEKKKGEVRHGAVDLLQMMWKEHHLRVHVGAEAVQAPDAKQ